jgi:dTDP-4-amino-4,6-dideoxy-D-galactose acyltransferase
MSAPTLEPLPWDSELFGFSVGRLSLGQATVADPRPWLEQGRGQGMRLVYCMVPWTEATQRAALEAHGARCVDHKVRYRKVLRPVSLPIEDLQSVRGDFCGPDLEQLALVSGRYSRFRLDPRIDESVYERLYLAWIRRSLSGELADEVLVIRGDGSEAVAMVTLSRGTDGVGAAIGLVAVAVTQQGRGLGPRLMHGAQAWCLDRGIETLEVVTQGANRPACALYERSGFARVEEQAVYHCWIDS